MFCSLDTVPSSPFVAYIGLLRDLVQSSPNPLRQVKCHKCLREPRADLLTKTGSRKLED